MRNRSSARVLTRHRPDMGQGVLEAKLDVRERSQIYDVRIRICEATGAARAAADRWFGTLARGERVLESMRKQDRI